MKPYCIVSDLHCHAWNQFSKVQTNGINSRLGIILDELVRAAEELKRAGGDTMYVAGDVMHTRGSIDPEVFNPTQRTFKQIAENGVKIFIIPGNHDLKGRDTTELGNAIQTLGEIRGVTVVTKAEIIKTATASGDDPEFGIIMIPWCATKADLRAKIDEIHGDFGIIESAFDLIIHVGIDGVLPGVPPAGLSSTEVASWGFNRVFAGDYHNCKEMEGGKVWSIGATTHQQWGDIGSRAGFLMVYPDRVEFSASHAPSFIELTDEDDPAEYPLIVDQNYVRIRGFKLTDAEINELRTELTEMGAKGVSFQVTRAVVTARAGGTVSKATTLDESVANYIDNIKEVTDAAVQIAIKAVATDVLSTVRAVEA